MTLPLRGLANERLALLLALQRRGAGSHDRGTATDLAAGLHDAGGDHGRRVVVAVRGERVAGGAGWIEAAPGCFGAPVLADDAELAAARIAVYQPDP